MAKTREKRAVIAEDITQEKAEQYLSEYAAADAQLQKITSTMDVEITRIREKYQDKIALHTEAKEAAAQKIQHYAETKKGELFSKKRSVDMLHGTIGFRTGTPALKTGKGYTWESVKNLLKEFLPTYVRVKEEADKESLLADRDSPLPTTDPNILALPEEERPKVSSLFSKVGVKVEQTETFFIELKKEEVKA